jgi:uncharacterized membrane protein YkgB
MKQIVWFGRISIFVIYFWFGALKVLGTSPAESLVHELFDITLSHLVTFPTFLLLFGIIECLIGIAWLIPRLTFVAFYAVIIHLIFTFVPMVSLPDITWTKILTPTIIGQYIFKNLLLLTSVLLITRLYRTELENESN